MSGAHTIPHEQGPLIATAMLIIFANGGSSEHPLRLEEKPGLERLRALVLPYLGGAEMEHVTVLYQGARCDMFVDEFGSNNGSPVNPKATKIYRANWLSQNPKDDPHSLPWIFGTAVLFDRQVWW